VLKSKVVLTCLTIVKLYSCVYRTSADGTMALTVTSVSMHRYFSRISSNYSYPILDFSILAFSSTCNFRAPVRNCCAAKLLRVWWIIHHTRSKATQQFRTIIVRLAASTTLSIKQRSGVCPLVCLSHLYLALMRLWSI